MALPNWPSGSPDVNPIENLWSIVKRRAEEQRPDPLEQVIALVFRVWESLEQSLIDSDRFDAISSAGNCGRQWGTYTVLMNRGNMHLNPTKFGKIDTKKRCSNFPKINT
jgi:hypothetical protein